MALIVWELLRRCLASALGHVHTVHLSLNIAISQRLTRREIQQPELSEGRPEGFGRRQLFRLRCEIFQRNKNLTKKTVNEIQKSVQCHSEVLSS